MKFNLEDTFYEQQKKDITCVHNFLNLKYKKPFGAIKKDDIVVLNISVPNNYNFQKITLLYKLDSEKFAEIPCKLIEISSEFSFYGTSLTLSQTGVYFYCFKIYFNEKDYLYLSCDNTKSKICEKENCFYMFCYNQDEKTINGKVYNNEIMYQIFPDRFNKSKYYEIGKVKNKRFIHENLNEKPQYIFDTDKYEATDFYLGNLKGITEKLTFIKTLGVSIIYLNPIFEAAANHRYNTADYFNIDPYLGTIDDFKNLCKKAKEYDIKIIIDGVFSHTGADSVYFNKFNHYNSIGAYQSTKSPFFSWYNFKGQNRDDYECWWGFKTLPNVNELDESYLDFICGENGVARFWLKMGADGWRLDVIDELPDEFLKEFRNAVKSEKSNAIIIGEVWENAVLKESYGKRRKYLNSDEIDSTMNYPFRNAIINLVLKGNSAFFYNTVCDILHSYPQNAIFSAMNMLSTHDTQRIITVLGTNGAQIDEQNSGDYILDEHSYNLGKHLFKIATMVLYFLPGISSIYYGDEAGLYGFKDPYNRRFYPWDNIDCNLLQFYIKMGNLKKDNKSIFKEGDFNLYHLAQGIVLIQYKYKNKLLCCFINCSSYEYILKIQGVSFEILHFEGDIKKQDFEIATFSKSVVIYTETEK